MRALMAARDSADFRALSCHDEATASIEGRSVHVGIAEIEDAVFDPSTEDNRNRVFVRIRGFSLNYRDKAILLRPVGVGGAQAIGSEFAGQVVAVGHGVRGFTVGQRVLAEMAWPSDEASGVFGGVPTNAASVELQSFPAAKLVPIPEGMSDEVAAAFTLGAQTAFAMIRRLELRPGEKVLVTAGTSNTSLFSMGALRNSSVNVYAVTSSRHAAPKLEALGVKQVIELRSRSDDFASVRSLARATGGFNAVIDPFSDVYLPRSIGVLGFFGRYVTCGLANQGWGELTLPGLPDIGLSDVLGAIIVKNIEIIGNCLGLKQDLEAALRAWSAGSFQMKIDSVYSGAHVGAFIERTYNATHRFGKVVYLYS